MMIQLQFKETKNKKEFAKGCRIQAAINEANSIIIVTESEALAS
jgi:hypothetical protein